MFKTAGEDMAVADEESLLMNVAEFEKAPNDNIAVGTQEIEDVHYNPFNFYFKSVGFEESHSEDTLQIKNVKPEIFEDSMEGKDSSSCDSKSKIITDFCLTEANDMQGGIDIKKHEIEEFDYKPFNLQYNSMPIYGSDCEMTMQLQADACEIFQSCIKIEANELDPPEIENVDVQGSYNYNISSSEQFNVNGNEHLAASTSLGGDVPEAAMKRLPFSCNNSEYSTNIIQNLVVRRKNHTRRKSSLKSQPGGKASKCDIIKPLKIHTATKTFKCEMCDYECVKKSYLKVHMRTHTGEKPFECKLCNHKCITKSNLKAHMDTHSGSKQFECERCSYKCNSKSHFNLHMKTHTGTKPYQCDVCHYNTFKKGNLNLHMRTHTGEKPFECEVCKYKCITKCKLKVHMRIHSTEKPVKCKICSYTCLTKNYLNVHMKMHTGEMPFQCKMCNYNSYKKGNLKLHLKRHVVEKPFECAACKYRCSTEEKLIAHTKSHANAANKPFECEVCSYRYSKESYLKMHMRTHTEENLPVVKCITKRKLKNAPELILKRSP